MTQQSWTVYIEEDPVTGDLMLPFPPDLLSQMGWDFGDTIEWEDHKDGSFSLTKKEKGE